MSGLLVLRGNAAKDATGGRIVYWHRELPPFDAEAIGEHTVEATSTRVPGTLANRDELWSRCNEDVMAQVRIRLEQEVARLGGDYAHVLTESVDSKHDPVNVEPTWLLHLHANRQALHG
jgi:hypothetical protein